MSETSPASRPALPKPWIDEIFRRMGHSYGSKFADVWSGQDPEDLRDYWAEQLAGFREYPEAIKAALDALDDCELPPTLPQFKKMIRNAANRLGNQRQALPAPPPMGKAEAAARLAEIKKRVFARGALPAGK